MNLFETAYAADAGAQTGSPLMTLLMMGGFVLVFYFMLWRPQSKRRKEHQDLMGRLTKGDEIVTAGGIVGVVNKVIGLWLTIVGALVGGVLMLRLGLWRALLGFTPPAAGSAPANQLPPIHLPTVCRLCGKTAGVIYIDGLCPSCHRTQNPL